ncbi:hypothetical protein DOY81_010919, partial [Sarcophaga bullata]
SIWINFKTFVVWIKQIRFLCKNALQVYCRIRSYCCC